MTSTGKIRGKKMKLLIVDAHEVVRKGLIYTLKEQQSGITFYEASNSEEAMKKLEEKIIDYVIFDVNLNGENGLYLIEACKDRGIGAKFIVFTASRRKGDFTRAKELGAIGYIMKDASLVEIVRAFGVIREGGTVYSKKIIAQHAEDPRVEIKKMLTEREFEILREIGQGLTNGQIADKLFITENTVKKHISSILGKLEFSNRTEVALLATSLWRRKDD